MLHRTRQWYCAEFHNDWTTETDVMDERDFAQFEFSMSFGRISYMAQHPWFHGIFLCWGSINATHKLCKFYLWKHEYYWKLIDMPSLSVAFLYDCVWTCDHFSLQWRRNQHHGVSNHRRLNCLLNRLFKRRSKKTSKLRVTGLCKSNSPVTGEFPTQRASNAENVSIWWCHHGHSRPTCVQLTTCCSRIFASVMDFWQWAGSRKHWSHWPLVFGLSKM